MPEVSVNLISKVSAEQKAVSEQILPASHSAALERFPDDYAMLDLGGSLWMLVDAIEAEEKGLVVRSNAL